MNSSAPRISIGMPVYNGAEFIADAIDSVIAQTFEDFELIVSDNASTDETEAIVRAYVERDKRVRYVRHRENQGAIWNFNYVVELARGDFFKWWAYDDLCDARLLEASVRELDDQPDAAWCYCQGAKINSTGNLLLKDPEACPGYAGFTNTAEAGLPRADHDSESPSRRFRGVLLGTNWCADSYGLIRTEVLRDTCMLPFCYGAEKVLMAELALRGRYRHIPDTLFFQRIHQAASSNLASSQAQQAFTNPASRRRFTSTRWTLLRGYVRAIRGASLSLRERCGCYAALALYLLQVRKWKTVLWGSLQGAGLGRLQLFQRRSRGASEASTQ